MCSSITPVTLRRLLIGLLIVGLTACSSTPVVTAPPASNLPTVTPPTEFTAVPTVTGQINVSSLTGRIVFDNGKDIYIMNADGTDLMQVTTDPADEYDPTWSPDGKQIAYRH